MAQWFGNATGTTDADIYSYVAWTHDTNAPFICPADGVLTGLRAKVRVASGSQNIRLALYVPGEGGAFIAQGSAVIAVSNTTYATVTHTAFVDRSGNSVAPNLTSGTHYAVLISGQAGTVYCARGETADSLLYGVGHYDIENNNGFPATLAAGNQYAGPPCLEIEVTPAGAGAALPVLMNLQRQFRN